MSKNFISFMYKKNEEKEEKEPGDHYDMNADLYGLTKIGGSYKDVDLPTNHKLFTGLLVPDMDRDDYVKNMVECTINLLTELSYNLRKAKGADNVSLPSELAIIVKSLAATLQWTVNSYSWRKGELKGFDLMEIKRKIGILK